jgi:hypothetical protein
MNLSALVVLTESLTNMYLNNLTNLLVDFLALVTLNVLFYILIFVLPWG